MRWIEGEDMKGKERVGEGTRKAIERYQDPTILMNE